MRLTSEVVKTYHRLLVEGGPGSGHFGHSGGEGGPGNKGGSTKSTVYHGTLESVASRIMKQGITPQPNKTFIKDNPKYYSGERADSVYAAPSPDRAMFYAVTRMELERKKKGVVFKVEIPDDDLNPDHADIGAYRVSKIPPSFIKGYAIFEQRRVGPFKLAEYHLIKSSNFSDEELKNATIKKEERKSKILYVPLIFLIEEKKGIVPKKEHRWDS